MQAQDIKFVIVCDPDGRLLGTVTDGDHPPLHPAPTSATASRSNAS